MQADPDSRLRHTGETLQTTALVHEAFLKLHGSEGFNDRQDFMRTAALAMRHIVINIARSAASARHGAQAVHLPLDEETDPPQMPSAAAQQQVEVDQALERLRALSPRWADVVACRFFGGYSDEETAAMLGLSDRKVRRDWLRVALGDASPPL